MSKNIASEKKTRSKIALCLFKYFPHGGLQKDFFRIASLLAEQYEVEVFTTQWEGDIPKMVSLNKITIRGFSNHRRMQNFGIKVIQAAKQKKCQSIISFNKLPEINIYFAADNCYQMRAHQKHTLFYRLTSRYRTYSALENSVFDHSKNNKIIALTYQQKNEYQNNYATPDDRFHVLPPDFSAVKLKNDENDPVKIQEIRLAYGIKPDEYLVLMVCSAFKTKGVDRVLDAMEYIPSHLTKKINLIIIGKDNPKPYIKQAKKLNLRINIHFLGTRDDILSFMYAADLFVHPARQEAAGKVLLEALACGLPVLTTKNCGYAEHIENADAGIVLPENVKDRALADELTSMLMSSNKMTWKKNALTYATNFTTTNLAEDAANFIKDTVL